MSAEDLIEMLADHLTLRSRERTREAMPALTLEAQDGRRVVVTLEAHHRKGAIE